MIPNTKKPPIIPLDVEDTDETREPTGEDLRYNDEENSFELDPETSDTEYEHPEPYDTAAPEGEDDNSTYDEENPYTPDEYRDKRSALEGELAELDEEVVDDELTELDEADRKLAETPEDDRGDLDEEGYPVKDDAGGAHNPIVDEADAGPDEDDEESEEGKVPPFEDPRRDDDEPIWDDPNRPIEPEDAPPVDERDPLGDKQIQSDDPTE